MMQRPPILTIDIGMIHQKLYIYIYIYIRVLMLVNLALSPRLLMGNRY